MRRRPRTRSSPSHHRVPVPCHFHARGWSRGASSPRHVLSCCILARRYSSIRTRPVAPSTRTANAGPPRDVRYNVPDEDVPAGADEAIRLLPTRSVRATSGLAVHRRHASGHADDAGTSRSLGRQRAPGRPRHRLVATLRRRRRRLRPRTHIAVRRDVDLPRHVPPSHPGGRGPRTAATVARRGRAARAADPHRPPAAPRRAARHRRRAPPAPRRPRIRPRRPPFAGGAQPRPAHQSVPPAGLGLDGTDREEGLELQEVLLADALDVHEFFDLLERPFFWRCSRIAGGHRRRRPAGPRTVPAWRC